MQGSAACCLEQVNKSSVSVIFIYSRAGGLIFAWTKLLTSYSLMAMLILVIAWLGGNRFLLVELHCMYMCHVGTRILQLRVA